MNRKLKSYVRKSVPIPPSLLVDFVASQFALKRRSSPETAFAEIVESLSTAICEDGEMAKAFDSASESFKGVVLNQEDAVRLAALDKRGAGKLGIEIAGVPHAMVPGLSLMYDAAIETLRSTDLPIESDIINARAIRAVERSFDRVLPLIGSTTVTALELALDDEGLADRLRQRAYELGTSYLVPLPPGVCEHCTFEVYEDGELVRSGCGTKEECDAMLIIVIVLVVIWLLKELWDWLT